MDHNDTQEQPGQDAASTAGYSAGRLDNPATSCPPSETSPNDSSEPHVLPGALAGLVTSPTAATTAEDGRFSSLPRIDTSQTNATHPPSATSPTHSGSAPTQMTSNVFGDWDAAFEKQMLEAAGSPASPPEAGFDQRKRSMSPSAPSDCSSPLPAWGSTNLAGLRHARPSRWELSRVGQQHAALECSSTSSRAVLACTESFHRVL
jgi:hypothetical protein